MALSPKEELELLELEEEEYQYQQRQATPEVVQPIVQEDDSSIRDAMLAGAAQGATFGFSDELGAAKDVVLKGGLDLSKWREYQKQREAANLKLQEESPWAYGAGEVAGGFASSAVVPGLGATRIAAAGRSISPLVGRFLAGKAGGSMAKLAGKGVTGAISAAPIGAAYGLGSSEADISRPTELAGDVVSGTAMSSALGLGLTGAGIASKAGIDKAKELMDDRGFLRQLKSAYDYGTKRLDLGSSKTQEKLSLIPGQRAEDLVQNIFKVDAELGKAVGSAIQNAEAQGLKINIDSSLSDSGMRIFKTLFVDNPTLGQLLDPKSAKLVKTIAQRELGDLTPTEARALKDELYSLTEKLAGYNSDQANFAKSLGTKLANDINMVLKGTIPEYATAAKQFEEFRRLVPETIISKGTPSEYGKVYMGNLKNPELKLYESSEELLKGAKLPGESSIDERATFEQLRRNLNKLQESNPQAMKSLGGTAEDFTSKLAKQSDELAMLRQAGGYDPKEGVKQSMTGAVLGSGRSMGLWAANKTGIVNKAIATSGPAKASAKLFQIGNDGLLALANKMKGSGNPVLEKTGNNLEHSIMNKSDWAKNAILFDMMQRPEYREMLKSEGLED